MKITASFLAGMILGSGLSVGICLKINPLIGISGGLLVVLLVVWFVWAFNE